MKTANHVRTARGTLDLRQRPRRLRRTAAIRSLVRETRLSPDNFLYPLFVVPGQGQRKEVGSMPGVYQMSVDEIVKEGAAAKADGVPGVLLFGLPENKDAVGSGATDPEGPVQSAIRALKREVPGLLVVTDVCLCEYTSHGHCGIVDGEEIVNDVTVEELARAALSHAAAGADIVAPSDMMDGRVGHIREKLDGAGFTITMSAPSLMSCSTSRSASAALAGSIWCERRSPKAGAESAASRNGP